MRGRKSRLHDILERRGPCKVSTAIEPSAVSDHPQEKRQIEEHTPAQQVVLAELREQTPSMLAAFFFHMESEEIGLELVTSTAETDDRLLIEKLPAFIKYLENLTSVRNDDHVEDLSVSTENFYLLVKCIPETGEGLVLITDKSQPATLTNALLLNSARRYVTML